MIRAIRIAAPAFLACCAAIFLFFWLGSIFVSNPQADILPFRLPAWDELKWWLGRRDTGFYIGIAEDGYKAAPYSSAEGAYWAFFPAYPLLLRLFAHGRSAEVYLVVGFAFSLLFFAAGIWYLCWLLLLDYDEETAGRTLWLFCFYPFVFSLAVFGPDSLLLVSGCAAFYYARREQWALAALAGGIACITRVQGVLVLPCLFWMAGRRLRRPLFLAPAGLIAFMAELWRRTGNPLAFIGIQRTWNNAPSYPFAFLVRWFREPVLVGNSGWDPELLTVVLTCALVAVLIWGWRSRPMPVEYLLLFGLQAAVLICRTSTLGNPRYVTNCFPFFLAMGILTKKPRTYSLLLAVSAAFFGLFASLFAAGQQHHPGFHFVAF